MDDRATRIHKDDILRAIPVYRRGDKVLPRPDFKDIHRMLHSYVYTQDELAMLRAQVEKLKAEGDYKDPDFRG